MSTAHRQRPKFKVGDWVSFPYGPRPVWAQVIEDRGPLGADRRRLYRIRIGEESDEFVAFEIPEDDLTPGQPDRAEVIDYMKRGGLVAILQSNLGGGKGQPKVWLAFKPDGTLTHTFSADRGLSVGAAVPFFALQGRQVFSAKYEDVVEFLVCIGLSRSEAEDVIHSVGTSP